MEQKTTSTKVQGYVLRFGAIILWGIAPIVIRYTSVHELHPLTRVCMWTFFASTTGFLAILVQRRLYPQEKWEYTVPYNKYFWLYVLAQLILSYSFNAALLYTSATTLNLFLNFTTIVGLGFLFITCREKYVYFHGLRNTFIMFIIFLIGCMGSIFLGYNELFHPLRLSKLGIFFCGIAIIGDVMLMNADMKYTETVKKHDGVAFTANAFFWVFIFSTVGFIVIQSIWKIQEAIPTQKQLAIMASIGSVIAFGGYLLTHEAFRRIDGLLVYLMINLTAMITFIIEVIFFREPITAPLVIGSILVIGASVLAEIFKNFCEKINTMLD